MDGGAVQLPVTIHTCTYIRFSVTCVENARQSFENHHPNGAKRCIVLVAI